jgi:hypothetical protein
MTDRETRATAREQQQPAGRTRRKANAQASKAALPASSGGNAAPKKPVSMYLSPLVNHTIPPTLPPCSRPSHFSLVSAMVSAQVSDLPTLADPLAPQAVLKTAIENGKSGSASGSTNYPHCFLLSSL